MYLNIGALNDFSKKTIQQIAQIEYKLGKIESFISAQEKDNRNINKLIISACLFEGFKMDMQSIANKKGSLSPIIEAYNFALQQILQSEKLIDVDKTEEIYQRFVMAESPQQLIKTESEAIHREELLQLFHWVENQGTASNLHPLLVVAIFYFNYHLVKPFRRHTERMSRILCYSLMHHFKQDYIFEIPLEKYFSNNKVEYQTLFSESQDMYKNMPNWISYFLEAVNECVNDYMLHQYMQPIQVVETVTNQEVNSEITFSNDQTVELKYLNKRQLLVLEFVKRKHPLKIADVAAHFKATPYNTIKKDLQLITRYHFLKKSGERKGTVYFV